MPGLGLALGSPFMLGGRNALPGLRGAAPPIFPLLAADFAFLATPGGAAGCAVEPGEPSETLFCDDRHMTVTIYC